MIEFKLPDVGEGMHEAEIVRWLVKPGDKVKEDQKMLEIQTDKALVEIPCPVSGVVSNIPVKEGQMVPVGTVLITFETAEAKKAEPVPATVAATPAYATAGASKANGHGFPGNGGRVRAAPAVRKKAFELDVDLGQVKPSSPDGRVLLQDVLAFAEELKNQPKTVPAPAAIQPSVPTKTELEPVPPTAPVFVATPRSLGEAVEGEERRALLGLRRRIAERMEQSWRTIPHVTTFEDINAEGLVRLRETLLPIAEKRGVKLTYLPLMVKAAIYALRQCPIVNSSLDEQTREVVYKKHYHIGLATATPDGLLVPVLKHADRLTLLELAAEITRLSEGARNRSLSPQELGGSTFTITNFGSYGGSVGTPIINPPEAAILGVGRIAEKAVAEKGQIIARQILPLALSFDHRLIDGYDSGLFIGHLKDVLEKPELLMLDSI